MYGNRLNTLNQRLITVMENPLHNDPFCHHKAAQHDKLKRATTQPPPPSQQNTQSHLLFGTVGYEEEVVQVGSPVTCNLLLERMIYYTLTLQLFRGLIFAPDNCERTCVIVLFFTYNIMRRGLYSTHAFFDLFSFSFTNNNNNKSTTISTRHSPLGLC